MIHQDAFIFRQPQDGNMHMLLHSMHPHKLPTTAWSADGIHWTPAFVADSSCTEGEMYPSFGYDIALANGSAPFKARRRERHQVLVGAATGVPMYLFNGVEDGDGDFSFTAGQPIQQ
jgi:hypothetical protein